MIYIGNLVNLWTFLIEFQVSNNFGLKISKDL